jgi:hypothetical protein
VEDAREGRLMMEEVGPIERPAALLMDRAYVDRKTRLTAWGLGFKAVIPPKRLFRRLKSFRAIVTRYDKNDRCFFASV